MSEIDLSDVVGDPAMADPFTIERSQGGFGRGGWIASPPLVIPGFGVVSVASGADLEALPEADRIHEARVFHTTQEILLPSADRNGLSDVLIYQGVRYRVVNSKDYSSRGFFWVIAVRMKGD